jgi:hypothetical protein
METLGAPRQLGKDGRNGEDVAGKGVENHVDETCISKLSEPS